MKRFFKIQSKKLKENWFVRLKENFIKKLSQFHGSIDLYNHCISSCSMNITEGAKFVADTGGAYWLLDIILSYQHIPKFYEQQFQVWKLERKEQDSFLITCYDGNDNRLAE
ncbi:MAG: hypothetical protein EOO23_07755, partial [Comamonadaceae bacterium]